MDLHPVPAGQMASSPATTAGVGRDHVGPFWLSLGDQRSCVGVDSPDVQELSQPLNKRLCIPLLSS